MRILVVDDDEILVEVLKRSLSSQRHVVDIAEDGAMGWEYVQSGEYELVLLDVNLPGLDGVSLCERMRSEGYSTPILLMTAKNASQDRILGLDAGADDYLTKPLDLGELNARVRALSRRGEVATSAVLEVNGLTLDPSSCQVSYRQQAIKLTAKEYSLLEIFLRNPARVFSRAQILDKIWTFDDPPLEESVKAHIKGLRKKLKQAGIVNWIENVYGIGYRLNPQDELAANQEPQNSIESEFERKLEQMWLKYQDKMRDRLNILENAVIALQQDQLTPEIQYQAQRSAHKLAGVLGMFYRDTGTDIAREIETLLQDNPNLDPQQQEGFIALVRDLNSLLALERNPETTTSDRPNLLLISSNLELTQQLQQLSKIQGEGWHQVSTISQAESWLAANTPYLVAIDTDNQPEYLALVQELNRATPNIPTIVISSSHSLEDRLSATRGGVSSFLVQPVTAEVIWQTTSKLIEPDGSTIASILIVDDDPIFLDTMRSLLEPWGIKAHTLADSTSFWEILPIIKPDLAIFDVEMPKINGIELCQTLRNDPDYQELPVLFLTAKQDAQTIQTIFEIGGDDYISKPVVGAELIARINNRLDRSRWLHSLAVQDRQTGLTNRPQSHREIETRLSQAETQQQPFCLAVINMTELPEINLKYGHYVGDRILAQWGKVIQAAFRHDEITAYWGHGDFAIAMPNLTKTQGQEHLNELLSVLRRQVFTSTPDAVEPYRFQIAFQYAVAEYPQDGSTLHSLYQACVQN